MTSIAVYSCHTTNRRESKRLKLMPHVVFPDADWWLWLDWNIRLNVPPEELVKSHENDLIVGFRHRFHDCAYEEHAACARMQKDDLEVMRGQMDFYRAMKFPAHYGLPECGVLLRRNTEEVRAFNVRWSNEVEHRSVRDQLSVGFAAWVSEVPFAYWPGTVFENEFTRVIE